MVVRVPGWAKRRWVPVVVAVGGGVVATMVGLMTRYRYGWDARVIMDMARGLQAGRPLSPAEYDYLSLYPNNLPLLAIDRVGVAVGQAFSLAPDAVLIPLNGICVGVTLYAVHLLVARVAGRGPSLVAQLATLVLVGTSPWLAVPYTDFYAMPFVVGGVALAVRATGARPRTGRVVAVAARDRVGLGRVRHQDHAGRHRHRGRPDGRRRDLRPRPRSPPVGPESSRPAPPPPSPSSPSAWV